MTPVSSQKAFYCRERTCEAAEIVMKNVTITNRKIITLYNLYSMKKERILLPGCTSNSKFKGNIIYHMKDCGEQLKRKEEKSGNKNASFVENHSHKSQTGVVM